MTNRQVGTEESEIDLLALARLLWHRAWLLILVAILVAAGAFGYTYCFVTPQYTAQALMYVNNSSFSLGSSTFSISASELSAAKTLVDTYGVILKSRTTLEEVIQVDNLEYTYEQLYSMISTSAVNSTDIFTVTVTSSSPAEAEYIANTIADLLPGKIADVVEGSDVRIVDYAVVPSSRTSPSYTRNTAIGGLLGLMLAAVFVLLQYLLDENIRTEDYLTQTYPNIPLLAVVPDMTEGKGKDRGGYYGYGQSSSSRSGTASKSASKPAARPASVERTAAAADTTAKKRLGMKTEKQEEQKNG
jgi:capsular polysaccharide biosynthesis protein